MNYLLYVMIPTLILSFGVQMYLKRTFGKWSQVQNGAGLTGMQVTSVLFDRTSLEPIPVQPIQGSLTDHYDPRNNTVSLSEPVAGQESIAAMAVSSHELGHVQQYQQGSAMIKARGILLPAIQYSPTLSYIAIFAGTILNITSLIWVGVLFFSLMVVFSLLTLPVEIDASRRAMRMLDESGLFVTEQDRKGSKSVLTAAAMTYLAAAVTSILQLLFFISTARGGGRRR